MPWPQSPQGRECAATISDCAAAVSSPLERRAPRKCHAQDTGGHRAVGVKTSSEKCNTRPSVHLPGPEPHSTARHRDAHHSHSEPHYRGFSQCLATATWSTVTRKKPKFLHKARVSSVLLALKIANLCGSGIKYKSVHTAVSKKK